MLFGQTDPAFLIGCSRSFQRKGCPRKEVVLKLCPTSPHLGENEIRSLVARLTSAKRRLDARWECGSLIPTPQAQAD